MITAMELRAEIVLDPTSNVDLDKRVNEVIALFESRTNRLWAARANVVIGPLSLDPWAEFFWSPLKPLTSLTIQQWNPFPAYSGSYVSQAEAQTLVLNTDYEVNLTTGRVGRLARCPWLPRVLLTVTGGYTPATAPADVKRALLLQAAFMFKRMSGDKIIANNSGVKGANASFISPDEYPYFQQVCNNYSRDF